MVFEIIEINAMIIGIIAIFILILIVRNKIEFRRYVPGLICIIMIFIVQVFQSGVYEEIFEHLENLAIISGTILLLRATILEYYELKKKNRMDNY